LNRLSFGSASCYLSFVALTGLAWMAVCKLIILNTAPGGTGDMTGINHLGWGITIMLLLFAVPALALIGFLLGAIGSCRARADRRLTNRGMTLSGLAIVLSPVAWYWVLP
jgi:hypothetical protein